MRSDARTAYLFRCGDEALFAVSSDRAENNIPRTSCTQGWLLKEVFRLSTHDPVHAAISPEPILRSVIAKGFYIWRVGGLSAKLHVVQPNPHASLPEPCLAPPPKSAGDA